MRNLFRTEKRHRHPSLFGELVDWMLAPFLILWPISMAIEYGLAFSVANTAYDRELEQIVLAVSSQVSSRDGRLDVDMPAPALAMMQARSTGETVFQVRGPDGRIIAGDPGLPAPGNAGGERLQFRDELVTSRNVRVAYVQKETAEGPVLVQVAEPEGRRVQLASDIASAVFAAQFLILPLAVLLLWFGLSEGFVPLEDIRNRIRDRRPEDLSPIDPAEAPEEVRPFLVSINDLMMRLSSSLKAQQRFVADAAHQMRTPLAGLKTQAELALREHGGPGAEYTIRQIAAGADRASRLVNQLLTLARADSDAPPPLERLDLERLAEETTREWVACAMSKQIDIGFEAAGAGCFVHGNPVLLRELLGNLIDNAIRYTPGGGRVTVRIGAMDSLVSVEVEDTGIGISPEDRDLVFERFYRVLGTGSDGSGLGLAIVREIAELHGAELALEGNEGGTGTLIRLHFPRSRAVAALLRTAA